VVPIPSSRTSAAVMVAELSPSRSVIAMNSANAVITITLLRIGTHIIAPNRSRALST
jgi:hypothetical protein